MNELEKLDKRWKELVGKPRSKEQIEESRLVAKQLEIEMAKEVNDLLGELKKQGIFIKSVWDLVNTKKAYPDAIDILIKHLRKKYHDKNMEGIVRALTVKEAKGKAANVLKELYDNTSKDKSNLRWVIGNAIATVMSVDDVDWVFSTVIDKSNGSSRAQLVLALGSVKSEQSQNILIDLLDDKDVVPQALAALGKMKSKKAKNKILQMKESNNSLIRLEAIKALKKID
ncbi:HEAT repeat domain-containing protein [Pedobacter heparinus]|uniref:HEAT repeat domain-containing protein n=1 Tax=Pedobacter heparinus TaxID=984 RepID=UPI00292DF75A|nr:HEAT repeat domain-containing protein [Pedobacter heparinus]